MRSLNIFSKKGKAAEAKSAVQKLDKNQLSKVIGGGDGTTTTTTTMETTTSRGKIIMDRDSG